MRFVVTRRSAARLVFIIGLLFMVLGSAFLLGSLAETSLAFVIVSFLLVIAGVLCAVLAIRLNQRSLYLFFAALFLQAGFFLLLSALRIIPVSFSQGWPLLSVFTGAALFPTGWHRHGAIRIRYLVSSIAFVMLGSVLLVFSLDLVSFSFSQFVRNWWPLLVIVAGLILTLISLSTKYGSELKRQGSAD
jgi:hypothetical protein